MLVSAIYYALFVIALVAALLVVLSRNTAYSAVFLILTMLCLGGIFLLMHQEFVAAIQVIVYAGAIMVLFLFVIMLLNLREREVLLPNFRTLRVWVVLLALGFFIQIGASCYMVIRQMPYAHPAALPPDAIPVIAKTLLTKYLLPFELVSVLLVIAIIGAAMIARRDEPS
jgi:NADH-quinone oxidoreductase subunit J